MATIGSLIVDLRTNTAKFQQGMDRANRKLDGFGNAIGKAQRVFGAFAIALAGVGFTSFIRNSISAADAIGKTADKVGLSVEALQELRFAAEQTGVANNTLDMAIQRLSRRLGEADAGTGELLGTLQKYNIATRDANGGIRSTDDVLGDLANTIQNASSDQEALRIAFKAFDSEGAALVNTLRNGKDGLNELRQEARDLGIVMDEKVVRSAEEVNDEFNRLSRTIDTKLKTSVVNLAAAFNNLFNPPEREQLRERLDYLLEQRSRVREQLTKFEGSTRTGLATQLEARLELLTAEINRVNAALLGEDQKILDRFQSSKNNRPTGGAGDGKQEGGKVDFKEGFDGISGRLSFEFDEAAKATERFNAAKQAGLLPQEQAIANLEKETRSLRFLSQGRELELEQIMAVEEAEKQARELGLSLTDDQADKIRTLVSERQKLTETIEEQKDLNRELDYSFQSAFENAIIEGGKFRDVLKGVAQDIARIALRKSITNSFIGSAGSSIGGFIGSLFGGARASGGPVSAGKSYLVGEQGPEMFVPNTSGGIVPNGAMGGSVSVSINNPVNISGGNTEEILREVRAYQRKQPELIRGVVSDALRRGQIQA